MSFIDTLNGQFPIRRTREQKDAFRTWFGKTGADMGYAVRTEVLKDSENIIVGDPDTAEVVFTAHYDTPVGFFMPNLMTPRNRNLFMCYQLAIVAVMLALACVVGVPVYWLAGEKQIALLAGYAVYMLILVLMLYGPANRHNANDNTSGVAAILETMARIPAEERSKAAFILFDNEEKGTRGSKAYAKAHPGLKERAFLVNMDCVGDGEHILLMAREKTRKLPQYAPLCAALKAEKGREMHVFPMEGGQFNSDQKNFDHGVAVCACRQSKTIGFYVNHIHTARDLNCDQANLDFLAGGFARFVSGL